MTFFCSFEQKIFIMLDFLKSTLSSLLAMILMFVLFIIFIIAIIPEDEETKVKENSVLKIEFKDAILDRSSENPFESINSMDFSVENSVELKDVLDNIEKAKNDENINGIYLNFSNIQAGFSQVEEIREKLLDFKESGKFIYAYSDSYSQSAYYLASVADKVFLNPEGTVMLTGFSAGVMFYKDLLDKLGIDMQIIRHGKFKSAVEPYMYNSMSKENREQLEKLLNSISDNMISSISKSRGVSQADINKAMNQLLLNSSADCKDLNFVDVIVYEDEVLEILDENSENTILFTEYMNVKSKNQSISSDKIAVIYATGAINSGEGSHNTIGSETTVKAIRKATKDENVKAIVLRVNSPGGSALASDVILRELELAKQKKKIVVSMGDYAASGGYYIACNADKIFANHSTITGSIGVFGVIPSTKKLLNEKLGLYIDTVNTHKYSDGFQGYRSLTDYEKAVIQESVEQVYETFITYVSEGRNMTKEEVNAIGQGRVWSGTDALSIGLVDEIGGLEDAIVSAASLAELEDYRVITLPKKEDPIKEIMESFSVKHSISLPEFIGISDETINHLEFLNSKDKIQARIPFLFEIR